LHRFAASWDILRPSADQPRTTDLGTRNRQTEEAAIPTKAWINRQSIQTSRINGNPLLTGSGIYAS
jgi:hypothetical protein